MLENNRPRFQPRSKAIEEIKKRSMLQVPLTLKDPEVIFAFDMEARKNGLSRSELIRQMVCFCLGFDDGPNT